MLNAIAIDDDPVFLEIIGELMDQHPEIHNLGCFDSVTSAERTQAVAQADLIFLDIEMPKLGGIEFVRNSGRLPQVIFVTAHQDYAVEAFEYDVTDYVVKPVKADRLNVAITKALRIQNFERIRKSDQHILLKSARKVHRVRTREISIVEADGDYVNVCAGDHCHVALGSLNEMQMALGNESYMRIHRSFLVRLDQIDSIQGYEVVMRDGRKATVSRTLKAELLGRLRTINGE